MREPIPSPPNGPQHGPGMVPGVRAGGFIFLSAVRARRQPETGKYSEDPKEQAETAMENMKILLEAAGASLEHVVKVTLYLQDLKYRQAFHEVWMRYYPENPPARIAVQVADASAVPGDNAYFALDVIALDPQGSRG